jgi:branched-subunit amino acid ABC-type transport system permease component
MSNDYHAFGARLAMPDRSDGYSSHIAPRRDESLAATMAHLKAMGTILRVVNFAHLALVAIGLLAFAYVVTYYYLILAFNFPRDFVFAKLCDLHVQWLNQPIGDRDVAYLILFTFLFIADNIVLRAARCMQRAEDHSMATIGAFLACLPVLNTVSLPFGLTAMILLMRPPVEKAFR